VSVEGFLEEMARWAGVRPDVRAVVLVGSQARVDAPADEFSDVDLVVLVDDPDGYAESEAWLEELGDVLLTFVEETAVGGQRERRVLFRSGLEVDFALIPASELGRLTAEPEVASVFARGYRVLHDELGVGEVVAPPPRPAPPSTAELGRLSHDFWYHALWAAKKLRRGETYVAKQACDCYLKALLVRLLAICSRARDESLDTWHRARFLERWAAPQDLSELGGTFARYDEADVACAILATADLFERLERELGALHVDHAEVRRRLVELLDPLRTKR
jgi:aminoglycoside 6-adenylyltransferase